MTNKSIRVFILLTLVSSLLTAGVWAAVPEPKSEGKFFASKGTKAEEGAEEKLGGPVYEYGKGLRLGPAFVKPYIGYSHEWDNNVFMDENGRKEDHIHSLDAGVTTELPLGGGQHLLTGTYGADVEWFERFDNQDHTDHTFNANLDLNYVPFTLSVDETFMRTVDRSGTEFTTRVERKENTVRGLLEVPFTAFFLESEVFDLNVDYRHPEHDPFDHHDFTVFQRAGIDIGPATQGLAEYGYKNIHYSEDEDRDGDAHQMSLGLRGQWTERLTYQAWGGFQAREYDINATPDFYGFVARGALRFMLSEISFITLKGDRSPQESTYDNQNFYTRNRAELGWTHQIAERWSFNTREVLQYNRYSRESLDTGGELKVRQDIVWESSLGLSYKMPNDIVSIYGEYKYRARESNMDFLSYDDQVISVGARANF